MNLVDVYSAPEACEVLWELLVERSQENDPHVNISHGALPPREQHDVFFAGHPYARWYLIDVDGDWIGYVNVTNCNEVGVMLFREYRGKGYGPLAVGTLIGLVEPLPAISSERPGHFVAHINPKNVRSIHLFESLGFKHIQNTYALDA